MTIVKQTKLSCVVLAFFAVSALPITSFAYDNLYIEVYLDDRRIEVDVDYDERGREVEIGYIFNTTDLNEAYSLTAERLGISISQVKAAAVRIDRDDDDYRRDGFRDELYYQGSDRGDAQSAIDDAVYEIAEAARFFDRNPNSEAAVRDLARARALLAEAEVVLTDREYGRAERLVDEAEYLAEDIVRGRSSAIPSTGTTNVTQSTETTATDRKSLQQQLLALLQQLIQLLQAQQQ